MPSLSDRYSDGFVIANASQTIAVTAPETETEAASEAERLSVETSHHGVGIGDASRVVMGRIIATQPVVAPSPVTPPDEMMALRAIDHLDFHLDCVSTRPHGPGVPADYMVRWDTHHSDLNAVEPFPLCADCYAASFRIAVEHGSTHSLLRIVAVLR